MLLRTKKKGVSEMIGYVLLISFVIAMSGLVYMWMKNQVPKEVSECPDGVSLFVENIVCNSTNLTVTIKNNGRFDFAGYFLHGLTNKTQEIATEDLSAQTILSGGIRFGNSILFSVGSSGNENTLGINENKATTIQLNKKIYLVEIIPFRFQKEGNKLRAISCNEATVKEKIECG